MRFLKELFMRNEKMNLNDSEKMFLKELVIEKIIKQQTLESSMPSINSMPKSILKKIEKSGIDDDLMMLPSDFEHNVKFDSVAFFNGNHEVGRVTLTLGK
jgi:hypothetical protein